MPTDRQHVLPTHALSTSGTPMGMAKRMPKEPRGDQAEATEATPTEGHGRGGAVTFCGRGPRSPQQAQRDHKEPQRAQEQPTGCPPPRKK